jgi:hypothetical protein
VLALAILVAVGVSASGWALIGRRPGKTFDNGIIHDFMMFDAISDTESTYGAVSPR